MLRKTVVSLLAAFTLIAFQTGVSATPAPDAHPLCMQSDMPDGWVSCEVGFFTEDGTPLTAETGPNVAIMMYDYENEDAASAAFDTAVEEFATQTNPDEPVEEIDLDVEGTDDVIVVEGEVDPGVTGYAAVMREESIVSLMVTMNMERDDAQAAFEEYVAGDGIPDTIADLKPVDME